MVQFKPSQSDIPRLRQPLGHLISGEPNKTMPQLKSLSKKIHPVKVTAVGDIVSRETLRAGIPVNLRIIDHISMRRPSASFEIKAAKSYRVKNPAGVITQEAWDTIKLAMKDSDALIIVEGEEDLLTLPCIVESPDNSLVLYGQPSQGLVVVETNLDSKNSAGHILSRMIIEETEN